MASTYSSLSLGRESLKQSVLTYSDLPVTYEAFNRYCKSLLATTHVKQWGDSDVWKVGGKVFAVGGWADDEPAFVFKVERDAFSTLVDQPGVRPAPYFASRGMNWVQHFSKPGLSDKQLKLLIGESHRMVSLGLTKKLQKELGLNPK